MTSGTFPSNFHSDRLSKQLNKEQATSLIIDSARQLVNQLINSRGHDNPPFLSEEYASLLGVRSIEKVNLGKTNGMLLRFANGVKIKINQNDPLVRQNFSCAHELGHLLFSELKLDNYTNHIEHRTFNPQIQNKKRLIAIEKLCDEAATELLMPAFVFSKYLNTLRASINSIERLAEMFRVSIQSSAIRASELYHKTCIVSKWTLGKTQVKSLSLSWPKKKNINRVSFSPLKTFVPPPSVLHDAYNSNNVLKGNLTFKVGKEIKHLPSEIKGFGYGDNRFVISLTFIN